LSTDRPEVEEEENHLISECESHWRTLKKHKNANNTHLPLQYKFNVKCIEENIDTIIRQIVTSGKHRVS